MITPEFLLASLILALIPGTGNIYTITTGVAHNRRAALLAAAGCTLGIVPHVLASIFGLSAIMNMSAQVFSIIKLAGAAYLIYLAWNIWRDSGKLTLNEPGAETGAAQIIRKAVIINFLNPNLTLFFLAFIPQFVSPAAQFPRLEMMALSAAFMAVTFLVFVLYGLLAGGISAYLRKSSKAVARVQQGLALLLAGFAVRLALSKR